jgi:hypothetical protein
VAAWFGELESVALKVHDDLLDTLFVTEDHEIHLFVAYALVARVAVLVGKF